MEKIYTPKEISEMLKLELTTIQKWLREGKLKGKRLGREWRVSESALKEFWDNAPDTPMEKAKRGINKEGK